MQSQLYFTDEKTKSRKGAVIYPRSHRKAHGRMRNPTPCVASLWENMYLDLGALGYQPQRFRAVVLCMNSTLFWSPSFLACENEDCLLYTWGKKSRLAQRRASVNSAFLKQEQVGEWQTAWGPLDGRWGNLKRNKKLLHLFLLSVFSLVEEHLLCLRKSPHNDVFWRCPDNPHPGPHSLHLIHTAIWKGHWLPFPVTSWTTEAWRQSIARPKRPSQQVTSSYSKPVVLNHSSLAQKRTLSGDMCGRHKQGAGVQLASSGSRSGPRCTAQPPNPRQIMSQSKCQQCQG